MLNNKEHETLKKHLVSIFEMYHDFEFRNKNNGKLLNLDKSLKSLIKTENQEEYDDSTNQSAMNNPLENSTKFGKMNLGGMTPNSNNFVNLFNNSMVIDMHCDQLNKDYIIESAHVKHNYNVNLYHQGKNNEATKKT